MGVCVEEFEGTPYGAGIWTVNGGVDIWRFGRRSIRAAGTRNGRKKRREIGRIMEI